MTILQPLSRGVWYEGKFYRVNLAFDVVLRVFELYKEKELSDMDKAEIASAMLLRGKAPVGVLKTVFQELICHPSKKTTAVQGTRAFDFVQDGDYIYASFVMDYGIDLISQQGRLDWRKFIALFQGLSERTKIREVMSIRTRAIPERTQYNAPEIDNLMRLKSFYVLETTHEEREAQMQNALAGLAGALQSRAKGR